MTKKEKQLPGSDLTNLSRKEPPSTSLISREGLIRRLKRGADARARFVESHLNKGLAFQIRSLRDMKGWTQSEFAEKLGIKHQNNISARFENPNYGKHTLTTLRKIAASCDVGLVVWFVPFSRLVDWATGTPHVDQGLSPDFYDIPPFVDDLALEKGPEPSGSSPHLTTWLRPPVPAKQLEWRQPIQRFGNELLPILTAKSKEPDRIIA